MKNFIFISAIIFAAFLFLSGCYTVLDLPERNYTETYEPYFPPTPTPPPPVPRPGGPIPHPPIPDPGPPGYPEPAPRPIIVIINPPPEKPTSDRYERPTEISDIRNDGEGRNPDTEKRNRR